VTRIILVLDSEWGVSVGGRDDKRLSSCRISLLGISPDFEELPVQIPSRDQVHELSLGWRKDIGVAVVVLAK
jgi:hypothetical protein